MMAKDTAGDVVERPAADAPGTALAPSPAATAVAEPVSNLPSLLGMLERFISDPTIPMERVNQVFDFYKRVQSDEAKKAFDRALAAAQAEFPRIVKDRRVHFESRKAGASDTDYKHEDLAQLVAKCGPILNKHGISYRWRTKVEINAPIIVTCILTHSAGHFEETTLPGARDETGNKNPLQGMSSAVSYLERYTFKAGIGVASAHDDDGRAGGGTPAKEPEFITEDQVVWLREALEQPGQDQAGFCKYFGIERLGDLPVREFDRAKVAIRNQVKKGKA